MTQTLNFIGLVILTWLFVEGAAPIQWLKGVLKVNSATKTENIFLLIIMKLVNCAKCSGMWFGFFYYWNGSLINSFIMGAIVALCSELFHRHINKIL